MTASRLQTLGNFGQAVWLDYIRRDLISSGELARLIERDAVRGLTSNPAIFEKAFSAGAEYADSITAAARAQCDAKTAYETLAIEDIRLAADAMLGVYESTAGADGYVSLEVSPELAHDTQGTLAEGRRLWRLVDRRNLMIKVPGTPAGIPAIRQLIAEGISVNVTLLFARSAYEAAANAYVEGIEALIKRGGDARRVASVASFFVSRIDTAVDALIDQKVSSANASAIGELVSLRGKIAIGNAKLAYAFYERLIATERWKKIAALGARPQRLLWASTGTKNPNYSDVLYVEELVGPNTVNTMPPATLEAFRDHGKAMATLVRDLDQARVVLATLDRHGISLDNVTDRLLDEGVRLFADAFEKLLLALDEKLRRSAIAAKI